MYYVPGFSNYLNGLVPNEELLSEDMPAYDAPVYYAPPTPQPVTAEPYYAEPSYGLPTAQPVVAQAVSDASAAPMDERSTLLASLPPEYLTGVDASALDLPTLRNLARSANALSYEQNAAKSGGLYALDNPADYYQAYGAVPISFTGTSGYYDKGVSGPSIDYLTPDANASYTLYSPRSGEVVATGSGAEGLVNLAQQANALNAEQGRKADWQLIKTPAAGGAPEVIGSNLFNSDLTTLGKIVATGLPIATAFIPGLNVLGSIAAGAGAGGLSAAMKDQNILKGALLGGATAGIMNAPVLPGGGNLAQSIGTAINKVPILGDVTQALGKIGSGAASEAVGDEIVVTGARGVAPGLVSGGVSSLVNAFAPSVVTNPVTGQMSLTEPTQPPAEQPSSGLDMVDPNAIVVSGIPRTATDVATGALNAVAPTLTQGPEPRRPDYGDKVEEEPGTTVIGQKPVDLPIVPPYNFNSNFDATFGAPATQPAQQKPEDEIVVTGAKAPLNPATGIVASTISSAAPSLNAPTTPAETAPAPKEKTTLEKVQDIADYMQLAGLGIGALGSLFGGGQQTAAKIANASGLGGLNPTFSAKLPGANIPGLGGAAVGGGPRTAADLGQQGMTSPQDYYRYGYGPEQSFFGYVPQGAPNTSQAYTGYAKGGFAVEGPGDGREDKIPAMLSDGEYVIDAETVALLGNGSNKAGADMLDQFRVKVRKHKGRELARGKFSKNAKRPEQYLGGGRA